VRPIQGLGYTGSLYTDKKEKKIFLIYKEIQIGAVAKSHMTNGLLRYGKYLRISSYVRKPFLIYDFATNCSILKFLIFLRRI
jgi:hypothetical protein